MKSSVKGLTEKDLAEIEKRLLSNAYSGITNGLFTPSIYSGVKSATTIVSGQSEAIATGATKFQAVNGDASNSVIIGLGLTAAEAEANCSAGTAGVNSFIVLAGGTLTQLLQDYKYIAWLGVGGTVSTRVVLGV